MQGKICKTCLEFKPYEFFTKQEKSRGGYVHHCKQCRVAKQKAKRASDSEYAEKCRERCRAWRKNNPVASYESNKSWKERNPLKNHLFNVKGKAKANNIPFNITCDDIVIPEYCPILGLKLEYNKNQTEDNSISIDRIIPELGYVKGNVQVISLLANKMKNSATPEQLHMFANWVKTNIKLEDTNE